MRKTALFNLAKRYNFDFSMKSGACRLDGKNATIQFEFDDAEKVVEFTIIAGGWTYNLENDLLFEDINALLYNVEHGNITANRHIIKRMIAAFDQYPGTDDFIDALEDLA